MGTAQERQDGGVIKFIDEVYRDSLPQRGAAPLYRGPI